MTKKRRISFLIEFLIWGLLVTFGLVSLIFNFVGGKLVTGIVYSIITLLSLGGLIFNIVYLSKHREDDHLPKE